MSSQDIVIVESSFGQSNGPGPEQAGGQDHLIGEVNKLGDGAYEESSSSKRNLQLRLTPTMEDLRGRRTILSRMIN